ncbi:hypothetical protein WPS_17840 [Vulcanimicrobium alpinum]|uniref:SIS domain-containing protein n=1 Tax=Vulcanimicrobium alpinum TaxID=3016050 RepID=A0AAN2CA12_UNVUL|nr:SIS domain-containing protein [Vulcanimicrobium alpinum]BDE06508.1 hypothetical protein WPS_17840 [Vulcanimicrobium alpinum]
MLNDAAISPRAAACAARLRARSPLARSYFAREGARIALAARALAERFTSGGRLCTFGREAYATDAAHVSVEFVHPVIVGKRALPAADLSGSSESGISARIRSGDIAIGFGPPEGDPAVRRALRRARDAGALTLALSGERDDADFAFASPSADPHVHQELNELLGHTLYESVHVFLERRTLGHDVGASAFLYPYLGVAMVDDDAALLSDVAASIHAKSRDAERLREQLAANAAAIVAAADAIAERIAAGATILSLGNGGSATDADDFAIDCVEPPHGWRPVRAFSLANEPAIVTAIGNDVGMETIFLRQIIAQARAGDIAFALSTSGGSKNVVAALIEARRRGMLTVALLGYDGGEIVRRGLADHTIVVRCDDIPRIQEAQAAIVHEIRRVLAQADGA